MKEQRGLLKKWKLQRRRNFFHMLGAKERGVRRTDRYVVMTSDDGNNADGENNKPSCEVKESGITGVIPYETPCFARRFPGGQRPLLQAGLARRTGGMGTVNRGRT